jgi:hypothetical protein
VAVRTVTVDLRLDTGGYLAIARGVVNANRAIDNSFNDMGASAAAAGSAANSLGRDLAQMGRRARLAERRMHELREEIARLQAQAAAGIPPFLNGPGGGGGRAGGMLMSPEILGAGGLLLGFAGPAIGAALSGVILAAVGSAGLAAGIASSIVNDNEVKAAFGDFGEFVAEEFETYGEAFDRPLMAAADHFHDRFASISPKIRGVLAEMAAGVMPLAEGLTGFIEKAGPGVAAALRGSLPVLKALAAELPHAGEMLGLMFDMISEGSEGAADALVALVRVLEVVGVAVGSQLLYLSTIFATMGNLPDTLRNMLFGASAGFLGGADTSAIVEIGGAIEGLGYKANDTASDVEHLTHSLQTLTDNFNNQYGAAIAYEEAIDNLAESVKENGRSMDIGTEKGRNNAKALMEVFEAARRTYDANIASGMSAQEAAAKYNAQIEAAKRAATAAGMAADEVNRLAAAQRALPATGKTIINTVITRFRTEGGPNYNRAPGVQIAQRDGGIVYARDGMMALGRNSGVASGGRPLIGFAEPGTGGEAFIARNAPASRSLAIANVAAGWHGGMVVPKGGGGGSNTNIYLTVNAGLGTNGRDVGEQIVEVLQPVINRRGGKVQFAVMGKE